MANTENGKNLPLLEARTLVISYLLNRKGYATTREISTATSLSGQCASNALQSLRNHDAVSTRSERVGGVGRKVFLFAANDRTATANEQIATRDPPGTHGTPRRPEDPTPKSKPAPKSNPFSEVDPRALAAASRPDDSGGEISRLYNDPDVKRALQDAVEAQAWVAAVSEELGAKTGSRLTIEQAIHAIRERRSPSPHLSLAPPVQRAVDMLAKSGTFGPHYVAVLEWLVLDSVRRLAVEGVWLSTTDLSGALPRTGQG